jgi:hypothetical protein
MYTQFLLSVHPQFELKPKSERGRHNNRRRWCSISTRPIQYYHTELLTMISTIQYKKGETVERLKACATIPLLVELEQDKESVHSRLPRYSPPQQLPSKSESNVNATPSPRLSLFPQSIKDYVRSLLQDEKEEPTLMYNIVASLYILFLDDDKAEEDGLMNRILASVRDEEDEGDNHNSNAHITRSFKLLGNRITLERWERLITAVTKQLHVVWTEHPLHSYASQQVPSLTKEERKEVMQVLQLPEKSKSQSTLCVMKQIQDSCSARPYGVLLDPDQSFDYAHSCLPTAQLELSPPSGPLALIARYDLDQRSSATISYIQDDESVERREDRVQRRTGHSCGCLRCIYEANPEHQLAALNSKQAIQLGHSYMASGNFEKAESLYDYATKNESNDPDLWHARGALEGGR